jgi:hypothetical protein
VTEGGPLPAQPWHAVTPCSLAQLYPCVCAVRYYSPLLCQLMLQLSVSLCVGICIPRCCSSFFQKPHLLLIVR